MGKQNATYRGIELPGGVEVVVIRGQTAARHDQCQLAVGQQICVRFLQLPCLIGGQHTQGCADLHAHRPDLPHHRQDAFEPAFASGEIAPRSAHAEARAAVLLGLPRRLEHRFDVNETLRLCRSRVTRRLRAV